MLTVKRLFATVFVVAAALQIWFYPLAHGARMCDNVCITSIGAISTVD